MAIPYNPFANRDKTPVSPKVPGTLPGVPFDSDMDKDITKEDKDAFAEIEKRKNNTLQASSDKRPSTVFAKPKGGSTKNGYLETILKQNLYHDGHKQNRASDVHKPVTEYETSGPLHGADSTNTDINKQIKERTEEIYEKRKREEEELLMNFNKFKDEKHGFDVGLRDKNFQNFQSQYDTALENLDAKNREGKKVVAGDTKTRDEITNLVDDGKRVRYEDKFDHNETNINKITLNKRLPKYDATYEERIDKYNALSVLDSREGDDTNFNRLPKKYANLDFIPLYFHDLVNRKFIPFRSYLKSLDDQHDATWIETQYLGRADVVGVYQGFTRNVNLSFECVSFSLAELHPMWQRINYLVGLTRPAGYTNESESGPISESYSSFIIPPIVEFNLGDIYLEQPVLIKSVGLTLPESNWELGNNEDDRLSEYTYLNDNIFRKGKTARYPKSCEITVSMQLLEKNAPKTKQRHFGHNKEDGTAVYVTKDVRTSYDKNGPFNEQLIHYKEESEYDTQDFQEPSDMSTINFREFDEQEREEEAVQRQNNKNNQDITTPDSESATTNIVIDPTPTPTKDDSMDDWVAIEYCPESELSVQRPFVGILKTDSAWDIPVGSVVTIGDFIKSGSSQGEMGGCYIFHQAMQLAKTIANDRVFILELFQENLFTRGLLPGKYNAQVVDSTIVSSSITNFSDCNECLVNTGVITLPRPPS